MAMKLKTTARNGILEIGRRLPGANLASFQLSLGGFLQRLGRWAGTALTALAVFAAPCALSAQGCAMCYTSAASAKKAGIAALQHGILILLVPPLLMFMGIVGLAFSRRGQFANQDSAQEEGWVAAGGRGEIELPAAFPSASIFPQAAKPPTIEAAGVQAPAGE